MSAVGFNKEKVFDYIPQVVDCAIGATIGIFQRAISLPQHFLQTFSPKSPLTQKLCYPKSFTPLDDHEINVECANYPHTQMKMRSMLSRIEVIKAKMGITNKVNVILDPDGIMDGYCLGSSFTDITLVINGFLIHRPEEELDFVITHELEHPFNNDSLKCFVLSSCTLVAETAIGYFFTPWAIPLIEALSRPLSRRLDCYHERRADLAAIKVLGTSKGAISFMERCLNENIKKAQQRNKGERYSLEGNDRHDLRHPPFTLRLAYALSFKED